MFPGCYMGAYRSICVHIGVVKWSSVDVEELWTKELYVWSSTSVILEQ
jgi:hypothetical protein